MTTILFKNNILMIDSLATFSDNTTVSSCKIHLHRSGMNDITAIVGTGSYERLGEIHNWIVNGCHKADYPKMGFFERRRNYTQVLHINRSYTAIYNNNNPKPQIMRNNKPNYACTGSGSDAAFEVFSNQLWGANNIGQAMAAGIASDKFSDWPVHVWIPGEYEISEFIDVHHWNYHKEKIFAKAQENPLIKRAKYIARVS